MLNLAVRNTGKLIREKSKSENIRLGRLFTKKDTARLMAGMLGLDDKRTVYTVLDPGAGTGILAAAAIEEICKKAPGCKQIFITCYENDPVFIPMLKNNLERIRKKCRHDYGVKLFVTVYEENYLTDSANHYTVALGNEKIEDKFDIIICNPPTELIDKHSPEADAVGGVTQLKIGAAYLFARLAARHLEADGQLVLMLPTIAANARKVTEYAATLGIRTCSENHGQIAQDSYRVEKLFNAVGHENYGLLVDMGNFACVDEDSAMAVSRLAPYAFHVHAKDWFVHEFDEDFATGYHTRGCRKLVGCAVGEGDIPVKRCIAILKKAGYDGYVSIEYEGPNDCIEGIKLGIENLKSFGVTTE
mgnify:CR=1 FL=1